MRILYALGFVAINLLNLLLFFLQVAAIYSGLEYWLQWPQWVCFALALALVFLNPVPLLAGVAGILGAHFAWGWPWWLAFLLFIGMNLLVMTLSLLITGTFWLSTSLRNWYSSKAAARKEAGRKFGSVLALVAVTLTLGMIAKYGISGWYEGTIKISDNFRAKNRAQVPVPESHPLYADLTRFIDGLEHDDRLQKYLRSHPGVSPKSLMNDGLSRLTDLQAERRAVAVQAIVDAASIPDCARILRIQGDSTPEQNQALYNALGAAPQTAKDSWFEAIKDAMLAVATDAPIRSVNSLDAERAFRRVVESQTEETALVLQRAFGAQEAISDEEFCAAGRLLFRISLEAPHEDRKLLVRVLSGM